MNFYKNTTKNAFFFVDNLHKDSGSSDDDLKSDDLFGSSDKEDDKKVRSGDAKLSNDMDHLNETDREKVEELEKLLKEDIAKMIFTENRTQKLIYPKLKQRKLFCENYHKIISQYYDYKRQKINEYFKDENHKRYFEDNLYRSSYFSQKIKINKKFKRGKNYYQKYMNSLKPKREVDIEYVDLFDDDEKEDFDKQIIKCKIDSMLSEDDIHSAKNFDTINDKIIIPKIYIIYIIKII